MESGVRVSSRMGLLSDSDALPLIACPSWDREGGRRSQTRVRDSGATAQRWMAAQACKRRGCRARRQEMSYEPMHDTVCTCTSCLLISRGIQHRTKDALSEAPLESRVRDGDRSNASDFFSPPTLGGAMSAREGASDCRHACLRPRRCPPPARTTGLACVKISPVLVKRQWIRCSTLCQWRLKQGVAVDGQYQGDCCLIVRASQIFRSHWALSRGSGDETKTRCERRASTQRLLADRRYD